MLFKLFHAQILVRSPFVIALFLVILPFLFGAPTSTTWMYQPEFLIFVFALGGCIVCWWGVRVVALIAQRGAAPNT
jgi:hypothetical protein